MLDALSHAIIRPPRRNYFKEDLIEASELATTNTSYKRQDVSIDSSNGHKLEIRYSNLQYHFYQSFNLYSVYITTRPN